jgi:hypothetical protein
MSGQYITSGGGKMNLNYNKRKANLCEKKRMYNLSSLSGTNMFVPAVLLIVLLLTLIAYGLHSSLSNDLNKKAGTLHKSHMTLDEFTTTTKLLASAIVMSVIHTTANNPSLHLLNFTSTLPIVTIPRKAVEFLWQDIKRMNYNLNDFVYDTRAETSSGNSSEGEGEVNTLWQTCPFGQFESKTENVRQIIYKSGEHNGMKIGALISSARLETDTYGSVYTLVEPGIMISNHDSQIFEITFPIKVANYEYKNTETNSLESILILPSLDSRLKNEKPQLFIATYSAILDEEEFTNSFNRLHSLLSQTYKLSNEPIKSSKNVLISMEMMIKLVDKETSQYNTASRVMAKFRKLPISRYLNATLLSNRDGFYTDKTLNIDFSKPNNIGTIPTTYAHLKIFLTDYDLFERYGHTLNEHYEELTTLTNIVWQSVPTTTKTPAAHTARNVRQKRSTSEENSDMQQDAISFYENDNHLMTRQDYRHDSNVTSVTTESLTNDQCIEDLTVDSDDLDVVGKIESLSIEDISGKNIENFTDEMYRLTNNI